MFRIWGKLWKDSHMVRDITLTDDSADTRTHKVFHALEQICHEFDLAQPIWLDSSIRQFRKNARARFYQDSFIEQISFDYLEIQVIEED
ncbi:MAG: hypothetical protein IJX90_09005 [Blautia sp.]|nr:hypothetical protein [Blautia sp.]